MGDMWGGLVALTSISRSGGGVGHAYLSGCEQERERDGSEVHFHPVILLQPHLPSFPQTTCVVNSILRQKGLFNQFL